MFLSLFTDELAMDFYEALPILKEWGRKYVDFRGRVNGKPIERQTDEELRELKRVLDENGMKVGALQSSLCKVHLPDAARRAEEMEKLEGLIRAANILDCRLVRGGTPCVPQASLTRLRVLSDAPSSIRTIPAVSRRTASTHASCPLTIWPARMHRPKNPFTRLSTASVIGFSPVRRAARSWFGSTARLPRRRA